MLPIRQDGDSVLRSIAAPLPETSFGTAALTATLTAMTEVLDAQKDGVALAAPQVGFSTRIFIVRYDRIEEHTSDVPDTTPDLGVFINPEIIKSSRRQDAVQEGCLSVRGIYGTTHRYERATVRAQDERGVWFTRGGGGILAQAFQHEIDHLDGILFIDHAQELHELAKDELLHDSEHA